MGTEVGEQEVYMCYTQGTDQHQWEGKQEVCVTGDIQCEQEVRVMGHRWENKRYTRGIHRGRPTSVGR